MDFYGYKIGKNKPKIFKDVLNILEYLKQQGMIEIKQDLSTVSYDTAIEIKIIPEKFDPIDKFTMLSSTQFNIIMSADPLLNKENILIVFLYINSYIKIRRRNVDRSEIENPERNPEAFWRSIEQMASELSMSNVTINKCLQYLTDPPNGLPALLIKEDNKDLLADNAKSLNRIPNIYVLNKEGYQQEIEWAKQKILEQYRGNK